MEKNNAALAAGFAAAAACALGMAVLPRRMRRKRRAMKQLGRVVDAVSGVLGL
jgi:hypothetical protein